MKKLGFTGTQSGMSDRQRYELDIFLRQWYDINSEFHHGDCVGADSEAVFIARRIGYLIHCHPPLENSKRAYESYDVIYDPKPYLDRNHDIVDSVELMLAAPKEKEEILRSGTWATVRYAKKCHKQLKMLEP